MASQQVWHCWLHYSSHVSNLEFFVHFFMIFIAYQNVVMRIWDIDKTHLERWINPVKPTCGLTAESTCGFTTHEFFYAKELVNLRLRKKILLGIMARTLNQHRNQKTWKVYEFILFLRSVKKQFMVFYNQPHGPLYFFVSDCYSHFLTECFQAQKSTMDETIEQWNRTFEWAMLFYFLVLFRRCEMKFFKKYTCMMKLSYIFGMTGSSFPEFNCQCDYFWQIWGLIFFGIFWCHTCGYVKHKNSHIVF